MNKLIDRIMLHKVNVIEYALEYISIMLVAIVLLGNFKAVVISAITAPTIWDITLTIVFPIASLWLFYIAARYFAIPLYDLLTVHNSVCSSPMKYTSKNRENDIDGTQNSPQGTYIEKENDK